MPCAAAAARPAPAPASADGSPALGRAPVDWDGAPAEPLELAFPRPGADVSQANRDRTRNLLWAAVHDDPPPAAGLTLVLLLALAVLQANGHALRAEIAHAMAFDAVMILRQRRAPLSACARAAELGMRKDRYLALRRRLLRIMVRIIETGSIGRREPETSADRQDGC